MADKELKLAIELRRKLGTTGAAALRKEGKIPAVVYGHGAPAEHIAIDGRAFDDILHHGGRNAIITLADGRKKGETALVRDVQIDPVSRRIIHADLLRVSADEAVSARLHVVTVGVARGVREFGGVMDVVTHELEIEGPASRIPEHLEVDVSELGIHDHVNAGDIALPEGFTLLTPLEAIVVSIEPSRTERELEEAAAGPAETLEPEIVGAEPTPAEAPE
ncbi:MAG: 50S ribosomal protein L25 [Candidatus Eremiobacteraeota bacterium]|nr:50S ribosomal protein L25 [Candidatus Eremiobacteraeota bacterium]MBV8375084.1 50S ribosomal protein L25 [Candidatus Eremiobacteraeota bacterium]